MSFIMETDVGDGKTDLGGSGGISFAMKSVLGALGRIRISLG